MHIKNSAEKRLERGFEGLAADFLLEADSEKIRYYVCACLHVSCVNVLEQARGGWWCSRLRGEFLIHVRAYMYLMSHVYI